MKAFAKVVDSFCLAAGPFPGVFFPSQHGSSNPWQPTGSSGQSKPNLEAAVQSFYKAGGPSLGSNAFSQPPGSQPPAPGLQFGAFGAHNFPQFGQLTSGFGQLPFIHTGGVSLLAIIYCPWQSQSRLTPLNTLSTVDTSDSLHSLEVCQKRRRDLRSNREYAILGRAMETRCS